MLTIQQYVWRPTTRQGGIEIKATVFFTAFNPTSATGGRFRIFEGGGARK